MATTENLSISEGRKALYLYVVFSEEEENPIDFRIVEGSKEFFKKNLSLSPFFQVRGCFGSCLVCVNSSSSFRHSSEQLGGRQNVRI
jgi:hypothetical protein